VTIARACVDKGYRGHGLAAPEIHISQSPGERSPTVRREPPSNRLSATPRPAASSNEAASPAPATTHQRRPRRRRPQHPLARSGRRRRLGGSNNGRGRDGQFVSAMVASCFCCALPRKVGFGETNQPYGQAVSRTTLRRAVPSFTVEVRRRPRLATTSNPDVQSTETKSPQAGFDRESHRASAAAFGAKKVDRSPVDVAASSPKGRILPSLLPEESLRRPLRDAALTRAESDQPSQVPRRPAVRTLNGKDRASRLPQNSSFSSAENAPVADGLSTKSHRTSSEQSDEGAGVSRRVAPTVQSQVVGESGGLALRAKTKRSDEIAISRDDVRAKPLLNDQRSTIGTDSPATLPSRADDGSPLGRRRTIMARYVFGDELKPGERWKRRLLTSR
jgi:hypothetical protein